MSLVHCHETSLVAQHINDTFENDNYITTIDTNVSPEGFFDDVLVVLAADAGVDLGDDIDTVLPMGYRTFLYDWVSRAFLCLRMKNANRANELADELMDLMMSGSQNKKGQRVNENEEKGPKCFAFDDPSKNGWRCAGGY